ncbi:MAG: hypothetical protein IPM86_02695 [Saprospiraceae bacterium]|nr:hypothetical protein [Saprospiraceae bacterium]
MDLAAHSNILYSSKDYGKTWTNTNLSSGERISDIEMHPSQSTRAWVTRSGLSQANKIFTTSDKGKNLVKYYRELYKYTSTFYHF